MRLAELNLLAYGKFTNEKLSFPQGTNDFHVLIGPNEAGKSTVRRAITELLFGMETRSPLGFLHAQSDLRVAGVLETGTSSFPFMRTKQRETLRSHTNEVLQECFLAPALNGLRQETFEELHCLDHGRLLRGGQGIVDPKNTVSQILFQAASGLEDFTAVREALGERASTLFARTGKSNHFARASEKFAHAQKTLKVAQVRTKAWVEASDALQTAQDALEAERKRRRELDLQITQWERARRLAPLVATMSRLQHVVEELGDVLSFPAGTQEALATGIEQMNAAAARLKTREEDLVRARTELDAIETDEGVLQEAAAIANLGGLCGLHPNHARDLPVRRAEVDAWLTEVFARSDEFGWGTTEQEVRTRLPPDKVVRAIGALLKTRGELLAEERAAQGTLDERQAALDDIKERLAASASQLLDPLLVQALELALPFKTSESRQKNLASALASAQTIARSSLATLARPELTTESLRKLPLPSLERVTSYRNNRQEIAKALALSESLANQSKVTLTGLELQRTQFERSHQVVTMAEVSQARRDRDGQWQLIKSGGLSLDEGAPRVDLAIRLADELADSRTSSETAAAEVQALRDQIERAQTEQAQYKATAEGRKRELEKFDTRWADTAAAMGLPGTELDDLPDWLAKKDAALQSADAALLKEQELNSERQDAADAKRELAQAMANAGISVGEAHGLAALCTQADEYIQLVNVSRARHLDLHKELSGAEAALRLASKVVKSKEQGVREWDAKWIEVLGRANLSAAADDAAEVESAIAASEFIRHRLERVDTTRTERIDTMEADLKLMSEAAQGLQQQFGDASESSPEQIFAMLSTRLGEAKRLADRHAQAQKYFDDAKRQRDDAASELTEAKRTLEPILTAAGVEDPFLAVPLVERWNTKSERLAELATTREDLDQSSDGLSLVEVQAECARHPAVDAAGEVSRLKDDLADSEAKLTTLVAAQLNAKQQFDTINGGDQAAIAEAQRHEALAEMSEVSEEYLQLATAGSLLKWAVDRYRDRKQGPLLERASVVFTNLTHGRYQKLRVDFDQTPPALVAYRENQQVKVAGLSDGTRDQLFLALRIAALELQAEQGSPVPFIADDLFINFDDKRSQAGLRALYELSAKTQVIFMSHQEHLTDFIKQLLPQTNIIALDAEQNAA